MQYAPAIKFNKMTRLLFLFICFFGLFRQGDISIISAESQQWYGGKEPAGKGINYEIIVTVHKSSNRLIIDKLWIENKCYDLKVSKPGSIGMLSKFDKNDEIHLYASEKYFKDDKGNWELSEGYQTSDPPIKYEGAALIGYLVNNKRKYKVIDLFLKKETKYNP